MTKIVLVDFGGTGISPVELAGCANALQTQVNTQFAVAPPFGWGIGVEYIRAGKSKSDIKDDEWLCGFFAEADAPGALGYHDRTPTGKPLMKCFPLLDQIDKHHWTVTASHEVLETLLDPELALCFQAESGDIYAGEVADAVEQDSYAVAGALMSNWVTPAWFMPPAVAQGVKYDWLGLCKTDHEIRPGGYAQTWSPNSGWTSHMQADRSPRAYRLEHIGRGMLRNAKHRKVIG